MAFEIHYSAAPQNQSEPGSINNCTIPEAAEFNESSTNNLQKRVFDGPRDRIIWLGKFISRNSQWLSQREHSESERRARSTQFRFPTEGGTAMGVRAMFDYTAIIIISRIGVSLSIIPEVPVFKDRQNIERDDRTFYRLGFGALRRQVNRRYGLGLQDLREPGHLLAAEHGPQVFIFTPRGPGAVLRWQRKIDQLSRNLHDLFGQPPEVIGYIVRPRQQSYGVQPTPSTPYAAWGARAIVEVNVNDDIMYVPPAENDTVDRIWLGRWKLWLEDTVIREEIFCPYT
ncbi:hypothetical protein EV356DRAFT_540396 [Viridothelium virens]|uniref:Uncharacterized protein n=1 Tax=Viridothelium virens TaxID=1048519 RepID=A0A6A6GTM3_VIRVR|nr:hypothetical protein EV356DRAFT_540396 [Viridothelium virens]